MTARILLLLIVLFLPHKALAADLDYTDFRQLPVQHEGRVKPLDTFARAVLDLCSGRQSLEGMNADAWLAETLFDPAQALQRPLFKIFRPALLGLPEKDRHSYSYAELAPALQAKSDVIAGLLQADEKNWTQDQRELMRLSDAAGLYTQLLRSFSFALPLNIVVPDSLAKEWKLDEGKPFTLEIYRRHQQSLKERVQVVIRRKGDDPARYNESERQIAQFAMNMQILEQAGRNNSLFRILPGAWGDAKAEWWSPWAIADSGQGSPESAAYLQLWQNMAEAYQKQDAAAWRGAAHRALVKAKGFAPAAPLQLETVYNALSPLTLASFLYLAAFFAVVFYSFKAGKNIRLAATGMLGTGALFHAAAIATRIVILDRPPVGTLYESVVFVALICVLAALYLEKVGKDGQGLLIGAIAGTVLLFVAQSFAAEDTMKMLVAVLNTNFWLSTHVLCITMGYGWCIVASLLAHLYLVKTAFGKEAGDLLPSIKTIALIALLFTAVGTILGGIWADQSWGRFWGWDPKENGALLIVLWLLWALHARISGNLKRIPYVTAIAALSVIVALAWFGVNLLNVGLHSYGFISGVAAALFAFVAAEAILLGALYYRISVLRKQGTR
jgi:ABC-type transport system involved in cytochrome c biogenesis permease subunit